MKAKLKNLTQAAKDKLTTLDYRQKFKEHSTQIAAWASVLNQDTLLKWLDGLKLNTSDYDRAMDAAYNGLKEGAGGGNHRLFDGGHTLLEAWDKVKSANPDDTFAQEVIGYVQALWNDVSTVKGLPFKTLEQSDYNAWASKLSESIPGVSKKWLYDLTSFDAVELMGTSVGAIGAIFMLNREDKQKFSEIIGSMGASSIIGANPIMGIVTIALTGYAFFVKKHELDKSATGKSAALTGVAALLFAILGMPFLIELVLVMIVTNLIRKKVFDNSQFVEVLKHHVAAGADKTHQVLLNTLNYLVESLEKKFAVNKHTG